MENKNIRIGARLLKARRLRLILAKPSTITRTAQISRRWYLKMPKPPHRAHQIFPTQKLLRIDLLYPPINVVKKHVRHPREHSSTSHHRGGEYRRHSPRRLREVSSRSVDHDEVPLLIVYLIRKIGQC